MTRRIFSGSMAFVAALAFALVTQDQTAQGQTAVQGQTATQGQPCSNCNGTATVHGAGSHVHAVGGHLRGLASGVQAHALSSAANPYGNNGMHEGWMWHSSWGDYWARNQAMQRPWHGGYYWGRTGQPTALVVPPTVTMQSNFSWGVSQNTMTPVYHQFGGNPPNGAGGGMFRATLHWPTHTDQFGVYPVRGPW